jgi:hypothetical protein
MNWHLFKRDDPSTYPGIDCPMLLCKHYTSTMTLAVHYFDNERKKFYEKDGGSSRWYKSYDECYYSYVGYIPIKYKTHKTLHCLNDDNCKIGCDDNGYCIYDFCKCEQQIEVNEYEIETKRIWQEF